MHKLEQSIRTEKLAKDHLHRYGLGIPRWY